MPVLVLKLYLKAETYSKRLQSWYLVDKEIDSCCDQGTTVFEIRKMKVSGHFALSAAGCFLLLIFAGGL